MSTKTTAALALTLTLCASAFAGIRAVLPVFSPGHLALGRYLVASLVLVAVAVMSRQRLPQRRHLPIIALMGFLNYTLYNVALNYGEMVVTAGAASFLINTAPVFSIILATIFLHERVNRWGWTGIVLSFAGATVIAIAESPEQGLRLSAGAWLIIMAALAASCNLILQKRLLTTYGPLELTTWSIWAGTLFLLAFSGGFVDAIRTAPPAAVWNLVYLGVFPAALAYVTWAFVLVRMPASTAVSFLYIVPVLTVLIAWLWLREVPHLLSFAGGALALAGVALANTRGRTLPTPN